MYISRVEINLTDRKAMKDLTHAGAFHAWVEECFPEDFGKMPRPRKLWRIDKLNEKSYLLIVSENAPSICKLEKYGVTGTAHTKMYDDFLNEVTEGHRYRFRVVLNPVTAISHGKGNRSSVNLCITEEAQHMYIKDRAQKNGFVLKDGEFGILNKSITVLNKANSKPVKLIKADYEGILQVTDVKIFRELLTKGFGKHKAYGFGLMTILPVGK